MVISSFLPVGSQVEVRSNGGGLRGVWFEATVLKYATRNRRYTISYASLVSDSDETQPLKETVHSIFVRPRPPPRSLCHATFRLHQLVEAFYKDGWWKGVVSEVTQKDGGNYKYRVCFPRSREELDFNPDEVREQLDWVKGEWVRAVQDQVGENVMFSVGSQVEVIRYREYFGAAWFVGTVLKVIGKSNFLVEYETLRVDDNVGDGMLLKEIVDLRHIRSPPLPATEINHFSLLDEVEAFHKGGWMEGVISDVLPWPRYLVKSKYLEVEVEIEHDHTALRPRFEWTEKHSVRLFQDKSNKAPASNGSKSAGRSMFQDMSSKAPASKGSKSVGRRRKSCAVERSNPQRSFPTSSNNDGKVGGESDVNLKANKFEGHIVQGGINIFQPCKKLKRELLEENLKLVDKTKSSGQTHKRTSHASKQSDLPIKDKKVDELISEFLTSSEPHKKSKKGKSLEEDLQMADDKLMVHGLKTPIMMEKSFFTATPLSKRSPASVTGQDQTKSHKRIYPRQKKGTESMSFPLSMKLYHEGDIVRGEGNSRPANSEDVSSSCLVDGLEHQSKEASIGHSPVGNVATNQGNCEFGQCTRIRRKQLVTRGPYRQGKIPDVDVKQCHGKLDGERGSPSKEIGGALIGATTEGPSLFEHDNVCDRNKITSNESLPDNGPSNPSPNICRQKEITPNGSLSENSPTDPSPHGSSLAGNGGILDHDELASDRSQTEKTSFEMEKAPSEKATVEIMLPFTKESEMWEVVGSMEVFRTIPQQPHFNPLNINNVVLREGMAIGLMLTFAKLAEDITKLQITDPQATFNAKLEALETLELHGFNVGGLRSRLERMLQIRSDASQCEGKRESLKGKIFDREEEKNRLDLLIAEHNKLISKLEAELNHYRAEKESMVLALSSVGSEVGQLKREMQAIDEAYLSAREYYDTLRQAPW